MTDHLRKRAELNDAIHAAESRAQRHVEAYLSAEISAAWNGGTPKVEQFALCMGALRGVLQTFLASVQPDGTIAGATVCIAEVNRIFRGHQVALNEDGTPLTADHLLAAVERSRGERLRGEADATANTLRGPAPPRAAYPSSTLS